MATRKVPSVPQASVRFELTIDYEVNEFRSLTDLIAEINELVDKANDSGSVSHGMLIIGNNTFAI